MIKKTILTLFILINFSVVFSQGIKVGVFYDFPLKTIVFSAVKGDYQLLGDSSEISRINHSNILYISVYQNYVKVRDAREHLGYFKQVSLVSKDIQSEFKIKPVFPSTKERNFEGFLHIASDGHHLAAINQLDVEKYLVSVVEAEGGPGHTYEYYRVQAIISRTYLYGHLNKHINEGFNVCDGVHCQVFRRKTEPDKNIVKALEDTRGLVISDGDNKLITAAFHSNSGGYTANSEDVWIDSLPYLRGVPDRFSENQRNHKWKKDIKLNAWIEFLRENGFKVNPSMSTKKFEFDQGKRQRFLVYGQDSIHLKYVRRDLGLRSTFFSIRSKDSKTLSFQGFGYGHGVGLSQIGAMRMVKLGYSFQEIIRFYYKNVKIIPYNEVIYIAKEEK